MLMRLTIKHSTASSGKVALIDLLLFTMTVFTVYLVYNSLGELEDLIEAAKANQNWSHKLLQKRCCTGHTINLLESLSRDLSFSMDLYFARSTSKLAGNQWSSVLSHVRSGAAQLAAGPFSVTSERARLVHFSVPFLHSGYALLVKHKKKDIRAFYFMKPFENLIWVVIIFIALVSAVSIALLEFNSPFGLNPRGRQRARNYTLGSGINMVISLMFAHTMPFKAPKSWAGKFAQNFISGFAVWFIASYTARMASILSAGQTSYGIEGVFDPDVINQNLSISCV